MHMYNVSVLGQEEGYTVKYTPPPEGVPEGRGVYFTVYPTSSPNTDIISQPCPLHPEYCTPNQSG